MNKDFSNFTFIFLVNNATSCVLKLLFFSNFKTYKYKYVYVLIGFYKLIN